MEADKALLSMLLAIEKPKHPNPTKPHLTFLQVCCDTVIPSEELGHFFQEHSFFFTAIIQQSLPCSQKSDLFTAKRNKLNTGLTGKTEK